mgnify:CR=1 FL=1
MHWNCKNCGAPNEDDARFCIMCGKQKDMEPETYEAASTVDAAHAPWTCAACETENAGDAECCIVCGKERAASTHEYGNTTPVEKVASQQYGTSQQYGAKKHTNWVFVGAVAGFIVFLLLVGSSMFKNSSYTGGAAAANPKASGNETIKWEDPALERAVQEYLGKNAVTEDDLAGITKLSLLGENVNFSYDDYYNYIYNCLNVDAEDTARLADSGNVNASKLKDLRHFKSLQQLCLSSCEPGLDLSDLEDCNWLCELRICNSEDVDLSSFRNGTALKILELRFCTLGDKAADEKNTELTHLGFVSCAPVDMQTVTDNFAGIDSLEITNTSVQNARSLMQLQSLRELWLGVPESIAFLAQVPQLTDLTIYLSDVESFEVLQVLKNLKTLELYDCPNLHNLARVLDEKQLDRLVLSGCTNTKDFSALRSERSLRSMKELEVTNCSFSDTAVLGRFEQLTFLVLDGTEVKDLTPFPNMKNLAWISLYGTQVSNISPLSRLEQLQILIISETQVRDLKPLSGLTTLHYLDIVGTNVTDLSPIAGLPLEYLSVSKSLEKQAKELFPEEIIEVFDD